MKKVVIILKNRLTGLNEELFLLENKTIVNQETFKNICEQISFIIFFAFLKKEEMSSGTHFTQQNVFLLL